MFDPVFMTFVDQEQRRQRSDIVLEQRLWKCEVNIIVTIAINLFDLWCPA